jgi:hypothetical protein
VTRSRTLAVAAVTLALVAPASAKPLPARPQPARPPVALTASPATIAVHARTGRATVTLRNLGSTRLVVHATTSAVALDLRGRPRLVRAPLAGRNAARWLRVQPRRLVVASGAARAVDVAVRVPRRAEPGDHHAALVFSTRALDRVRVGVRMRLAVRVAVRAPGVVRRRVVVRSLLVRRAGRVRTLELRLANRGNVTEELTGRVAIRLATKPPTIVRLGGRRTLLPGRDAVVVAAYRGRHRGVVTARVTVRGGTSRSYTVRL